MTAQFKLSLESYTLDKCSFQELVEGVFVTISNDKRFNGVTSAEIANQLFDNGINQMTAFESLNKLQQYDFDFKIAIALRAVVAGLVLNISRTNNTQETDLREVWKILYPTLNNSSGLPIHASLGSQGFLSIPLYSKGIDKNISELLRLHFWDKSLHDYPTYRKVNLFSIHSHQFHATSWILKGHIINSVFEVKPTELKDEQNGFCFFNIEWDETKQYRSNLKKSFAVNSGKFISVTKKSSEKFIEGQSYEIACGDFHDSLVDLDVTNDMTSTFFLFDGTKGRISRSEVLGPASIKRNEVIRDNNVDSNYLIEKLNSLFSYNQNWHGSIRTTKKTNT